MESGDRRRQTRMKSFLRARKTMLLVMLGGALGTYLRYLVTTWFNSHQWAKGFPYGTMFINVTGSFILGAAALILLERLPPEHVERHLDWYLLIGTGFCGGYTTFSTFELETYTLVAARNWLGAFANVLGSVIAGLVCVVCGAAAAALLFPH